MKVGWPIWRVTPRKSRPGKPFPVPTLRVRESATNEFGLNTTLSALVDSVKQRFASVSKLREQVPLRALPLEGFECIATLTDCLLDCRDAAYIDGNEPLIPPHLHRRGPQVGKQPDGPQFFLTDDPSDFLILCGVLHTNTGKATYQNLVVYDVTKEAGVLDVSDRSMNNSAVQFLHGTPYEHLAGLLYVWKFARHCPPEDAHWCVNVPTKFPGVPLDRPLTFVERAYLQLSTAVGPDVHTLLPPIVLHYSIHSLST